MAKLPTPDQLPELIDWTAHVIDQMQHERLIKLPDRHEAVCYNEPYMRCPYCQATDTQVLDTRKLDHGATIRRRRRCETCGRRFTTVERIEPPSLLVIKKSGAREPYDRNKVLGGIQTALYRRPIAPDAAERIVTEVEAELMAQDLGEVPTTTIGDLVMDRLRAVDEVAYIRFASVYRSFTDVGKLREAVDALRDDTPRVSL